MPFIRLYLAKPSSFPQKSSHLYDPKPVDPNFLAKLVSNHFGVAAIPNLSLVQTQVEKISLFRNNSNGSEEAFGNSDSSVLMDIRAKRKSDRTPDKMVMIYKWQWSNRKSKIENPKKKKKEKICKRSIGNARRTRAHFSKN